MMNPYASYQQNQILEAPSEDILLQLVQGAMVRAKQARELNDQGRKVQARESRLRCFEIICYLDETLDREDGGEIVEELEALYAFMQREINASTREDDFKRLMNVEEVLSTLYQGWKEAVAEYKENKKAETGQEKKVAQVG